MKYIFCILMSGLFSAGALTSPKAPDFTLTSLKGEKFNLYQRLKQGPVLIDFWATWCKPCLEALPETDRLHEKYSPRGLQVVAISTDSPKSRSKVKGYVRSKKFRFEVLLDTDQEVRSLFGGKQIPLVLIIDRKGGIVLRRLGYNPGDQEELTRAVEAVLTAEFGEDKPDSSGAPDGKQTP